MFCWSANEAQKDTVFSVDKNAIDTAEIHGSISSILTGLVDLNEKKGGDTFTLYLVRHGEASHNVEEKSSQKKAKEDSLMEGLTEDDPETKRRMKEAREQVLMDETLFDAPLSDNGKGEAQEAHEKLVNILNDESASLEKPTQVLVSPLQRTLQTAAIVFPDHSNIKVREEIRERDTGRPPDIRSSTEKLRKRKTFNRFSMSELQKQSFLGHDDLNPICQAMSEAVEATFDVIEEGTKMPGNVMRKLVWHMKEPGESQEQDKVEDKQVVEEEKPKDKDDAAATPVPISLPKGTILKSLLPKKVARQYLNGEFVQEDEAMLRKRTLQLFHILRQSNHRSVAVVSHKGYLRGLERGPFGQSVEDSPEFKNCEIRVYKVSFGEATNDLPEKVERVV